MNLLVLCWEFFKTGLFAIGGGLATIPFLTQMSQNHPEWFSLPMLADMIAVSESTPGPIGINMATYIGYTVAGIPGSLLATFSIVLPSVVIIVIIARMLDRYMKNKYVNRTFMGLRPAVAGLIGAAGFEVIRIALTNSGVAFSLSEPLAFFNLKAIAMFAVMFLMTQLKFTKKLHPAIYIVAAAVAGIFIF